MSGTTGRPAPAPDNDTARGLLAAAAAYGLWGFLPLYFRLLKGVDPVEIVTQRVIWSLILLTALMAMQSALPGFLAVIRNRKLMRPLAVSAVMIAINWLVYVWAVNNGHVVAASLGYFLNPLVNILLGFLVLKERLRRGQTVAIVIAAIGVGILATAALDTLWISLALALSFAFYGLVRKLTPVPAVAGLGAETLVLVLPAIAYLVWLNGAGGMSFGKEAGTTALMVLAGGLTSLPLILFAMAARRLPMATLGVLQYIAPILQFLSGVVIFGETLNRGQLISFALIWVGLILFTLDAWRASRRA